MPTTDLRTHTEPAHSQRSAESSWTDVGFVVTHGRSSLDLYSEKLASHLPVHKIHSDAYQRSAELFAAPVWSRAAARSLWSDVCFARRLHRENRSLHLPNHHCGRYASNLKKPYLVTVHDLMRMRDTDSTVPLIQAPSRRERLLLHLDVTGIQQATGVIAVSQTTKAELMSHLQIPERRVTVVYEGVDHELFRPVSERLIDQPYILFVGSEQPRKNLPGLLQAFYRLKQVPGFEELKLVKVGAAGDGQSIPFRAITRRAIQELGLAKDVILTGRVPEQDLPAYYSGAECLVLPSFYEGFGLPPIEAMACGCPVIVSDRGSLPEVAGPGALVIDPSDDAQLAEAILHLLTDNRARAELKERGLQHAASFTWQACAEGTIAAYERFL